ncbi:protein of unknown function (plasmid) [Caballeronia sp. S22]
MKWRPLQELADRIDGAQGREVTDARRTRVWARFAVTLYGRSDSGRRRRRTVVVGCRIVRGVLQIFLRVTEFFPGFPASLLCVTLHFLGRIVGYFPDALVDFSLHLFAHAFDLILIHCGSP